jgi:SAM-dependent methyltransferase
LSARADTRYWDAIGTAWHEQHRQTLWRAHSDAVNSAWLASRLPTRPVERLLKTDLFDEALAAGLYPLLSARARSVFGIDIAASTLRGAGERYTRLHGAQADVRSLPFADAAFDEVVSTSTLDHFASTTDIAAGLAELHRVLRAGGRLLLTLDNLANPVVAVRNALPARLLNGLGIVPYGIGAACGPRRLNRLVAHAGFEVLEVDAILHCPRALAVAAARVLESHRSQFSPRFSERLMPFERLAAWPTRFLTGYFIAVVARKGEGFGASSQQPPRSRRQSNGDGLPPAASNRPAG